MTADPGLAALLQEIRQTLETSPDEIVSKSDRFWFDKEVRRLLTACLARLEGIQETALHVCQHCRKGDHESCESRFPHVCECHCEPRKNVGPHANPEHDPETCGCENHAPWCPYNPWATEVKPYPLKSPVLASSGTSPDEKSSKA